MNKFKKQARARLDTKRTQIVKSGHSDMGYKGQHKKGCGLFVLIIGLVFMTAPAVAWYITS